MINTFCFLSSTPHPYGEFKSLVIGISDGDAITVLNNKTPIKIRLNGIDAPEKTQDFGSKAKQFVSSLAYKKEVTVIEFSKDKYRRLIADIILPDGRNLNHELVRNGYAWWYRKFVPKDMVLKQLESEARSKKIGLWQMPNPIAPWDFNSGAYLKLSTDAPIKKSKSNICHKPGSKYYHKTLNFESYKTLEECLKSGGREAQ
jgi:micrococcal nuclease